MGAPPNPVDGTKYAELLMGVPMVLEYDDATGGFKLVIDVENSLEVTMTGIVVSIAPSVEIANWQFGAQYLEDDPFVGGSTGTMVLAVRTDTMQSWVNADGDFATLNVDGMGRLYTWTTGSYTFADTELPPAAVLADGFANPTAPAVGAFGMGWNGATWDRLVGLKEAGLNVSLISGSFPRGMEVAISDNLANPDRALSVAAHLMSYDGSTWDRVDQSSLGTDAENVGQNINVAAFNLGWAVGGGGGDWARFYMRNPSSDAVPTTDYALMVQNFNMGWNGSTWDRIRGNKERGLYVSMISGSFPGQVDAIEIDDTIAGTLRAGLVGSANLMYDVVGGNWERDPARLPGDAVANAVLPQRSVFGHAFDYSAGLWSRLYGGDLSADAIGAGAGGAALDSSLNVRAALLGHRGNDTFDRLIGTKETGLNVSMISGSWPAGADNIPADAMSAPLKSMSVTAHLMGYNGVTYDRIYMGLSGSMAVDLITQLDPVNDEVTAYVTGTVSANILTDQPLVVTEDEVTAYITGTTALNLMGKTIVRAVVNISGSGAGEETLIAAVGGEKIKVLETMLIGNADVSVFFQSGFTGTALTGPLSLPSDGDGFFIPTPAQIEAHHFETAAGEALVLDIDANVLLGGWINYYTEA